MTKGLFKYHPKKHKARAKIPGKLYLAGEYAILTPDQPALIMAVDRYITANIKQGEKDQGQIQSGEHLWHYRRQNGQLDLSTLPQEEQSFWRYTQGAISLVEQLVTELDIEIMDYIISLESDLIDLNGKKLGFGSSGAVTIAIIFALLHLYGLEPKNALTLYKLAAIAQTQLGATGSFGDLAASSHGGVVYYQSLDRTWLQEILTTDISLIDLLTMTWPKLKIQAISGNLPVDIYFGWTGTPASTDHLVSYLQAQLPDNPTNYHDFVTEASITVHLIYEALKAKNGASVVNLIQLYAFLLRTLAQDYALDIYTPKLDELTRAAKRLDMAGKPSGAGGGDCGIAVSLLEDSPEKQQQLFREWEKVGIIPLTLQIAPTLIHKTGGVK